MAQVTLRVLDGADRGRVYEQIETPITIGREEGNTVQLNDDRISRFHIKIQEDQDKVVLTDLESTNGTRVNGEETQLRLLRFGDVIQVGRSSLLYGTREQIMDRLVGLREDSLPTGDMDDVKSLTSKADSSVPFDFELEWAGAENLRGTLHIPSTPDVPEGLSPGQAAQVSEILEYLHLRTRALIKDVKVEEESDAVVSFEQWQELLEMQSLLAEYLRRMGEPDSQ